MLIINTESETLVKSKMVYLFINGNHVDTLKTKQVKQYKLDPGTYKVSMRLNFYRTDAVDVEIKAGKTRAFELKLKNNWKFFMYFMLSIIVGMSGTFLVRSTIGVAASNVFIVLFFALVYFLKIKFSKNDSLTLEEIIKQ